MCYIVASGLLTCLVFIIVVYKLYSAYMIDEIVYDAETCMVSDYAVELPFKKASYDLWY